MASKLSPLLATGETVQFHAYWSWREIAHHALGAVAFTLLVLFGVAVFLGGHGVAEVVIAAIPILVVRLWWMRRSEVLVTDRRLLHCTGHGQPALVEVAICDIEAIVRMPGFLFQGDRLSIRERGKAPVRISNVPGLMPLWRVLAAKAGLPPPPPFGMVMKVAYYGTILIPIMSGMGLVAVLAIVLWDWTPDFEPVGFAVFLAMTLTFGLPAILIVFLAGVITGWILTALLIRCFFTATQARQLACIGRDPNEIDSRAWGMPWVMRQSLRFYSWLYGQRLRCKDKS